MPLNFADTRSKNFKTGKPICTANATRTYRHRDVPNQDPLVIQKVPDYLNTKNHEINELLPHKVDHRFR
jgi:hypothetical protein